MNNTFLFPSREITQLPTIGAKVLGSLPTFSLANETCFPLADGGDCAASAFAARRMAARDVPRALVIWIQVAGKVVRARAGRRIPHHNTRTSTGHATKNSQGASGARCASG